MQLHKDDFLWKYYEKYFTLSGDKVEKPTTLCPYFWTAVGGMIGSFFMEARLWLVWLITAGNCGAIFYILRNHKAYLQAMPFWLFLPILITFVSLGIALFATVVITAVRLQGWWQKLYGWALAIAILALAAFGIIGLVLEAIDRWNQPSATTESWEEVALTGIAVLGIAALLISSLVAVCVLVYLVWAVLMHPMASWRFFKNIVAMFLAIKNKACPLVTSPEGYVFEEPKEVETEDTEGDEGS